MLVWETSRHTIWPARTHVIQEAEGCSVVTFWLFPPQRRQQESDLHRALPALFIDLSLFCYSSHGATTGEYKREMDRPQMQLSEAHQRSALFCSAGAAGVLRRRATWFVEGHGPLGDTRWPELSRFSLWCNFWLSLSLLPADGSQLRSPEVAEACAGWYCNNQEDFPLTVPHRDRNPCHLV